MEQRVTVTVEQHVAQVRMVRGDKRNGLDVAMFEALVAAGERVAADTTIRAVVLSGEGPAFCGGLDFPSVMAAGPDAFARLLHRDDAVSPANVAQRIAWVWQEVPVPVIAALHGAVLGGGMQLALGADLRVAGPDLSMGLLEIEYGLVPDMGVTRTLLPLVGLDVAKELVWTARRVGAEEALRLGLVTRLADDPWAAATALAQQIAARSPHALAASKAVINAAADLDVAASLRAETAAIEPLLMSPNQLEALAARMQRRAPVFADRG